MVSACVENIQTPNSLLLGGESAVGKSTISTLFLDSYKDNGEPITHIDSDEIKEHLPEYQEMIESKVEAIKEKAAFHVHDESSDIAEELLYI
ncbi:TPA: zeta toxin family protein [Bacillus thuringiensis]|nr:zeta toxin family protein [Bacillus thuringiensis]